MNQQHDPFEAVERPCAAAWRGTPGTLLIALILLGLPVLLMISGPGWFSALTGTPRGNQRLLNGIAVDDVDQVRLALAEGALLDRPSPAGMMPLTLAAYASPPEIVRELLRAGADPGHISDFGVTALITAAQNNRIETVRLLLDAGADPDQHLPGRQTALCSAALFGNLEIVAMLLDAGSDPHLTGAGGKSPHMQAVAAGHVWIVELFSESVTRIPPDGGESAPFAWSGVLPHVSPR